MSERLPDSYFAAQYAESPDPWRLADRWYERRKYALTMAMLPAAAYRHAFEPGCSVGVLTALLADRCAHVTATDVADAALESARERLRDAGRLDRVSLQRSSLDDEWPSADVDLVVLSEVAYYLDAAALRRTLDRECPRLAAGTTMVTAHWRHPVDDYPLTGDTATALIVDTAGMCEAASYRDSDVAIAVLTKGASESVAWREGLPGARPTTVVSDGFAAGR